MPSFTIFGDSLMKGVVLDAVKNRYTQLKNCFVNLFSNKNKYQVNNFASFGCTVTKGLSIVEKRKDVIPESDYVVIEFGGNDCNFDWAKIADTPKDEHIPVTPLDQFGETYCEMIDTVKNCGKIPFVLNLPPLDSYYFFRWVSKGLDADNILLWLGDEHHTFRWHASYSKTVEEVAKLKDVPLVDIRSPFFELPEYRSYFCEDGMHPNEKGHTFINQTVDEFRLDYVS